MIQKLLFSFLMSCSIIALAQYDIDDIEKDTTAKVPRINQQNLLSRTYVGGELALQFGGFTRLYAAPVIGYDIFKPFSVGVSGMYQLFRQRFSNGAVINSHTFGGGVFARYRPIPQIIVQTEIDLYNTEDFTTTFGSRVNVPAFMAGLGYAADFGGRAYYQAILMYDFIGDINMPLPRLINQIPLYLRFGLVFYLGDRNY